MRERKFSLALAIVLLAGCDMAANADTFKVWGLLFGSVMTRDACDHADTSVWVTVDGRGECIRYFHSGLDERNKVVHVWLHGDRMWQTSWGIRWPLAYENETAGKQQRRADRVFQQFGVPYIRLSRPGTYGSSGFHHHRRRPRNVAIVQAALDALKTRHGIGRFAVSGQSGGGHLVGALLAARDDIQCAVSTAGVLAVKQRNEARGWSTDVTGYSDFYDPIDHVHEIPTNEQRRIFLVADPGDTNVPFETQESYFEALRDRGHHVWLVPAMGEGDEHHSLSQIGFPIVKWCIEGVSSREIVERASSTAS